MKRHNTPPPPPFCKICHLTLCNSQHEQAPTKPQRLSSFSHSACRHNLLSFDSSEALAQMLAGRRLTPHNVYAPSNASAKVAGSAVAVRCHQASAESPRPEGARHRACRRANCVDCALRLERELATAVKGRQRYCNHFHVFSIAAR